MLCWARKLSSEMSTPEHQQPAVGKMADGVVGPPGVEPGSTASEAVILSIVL